MTNSISHKAWTLSFLSISALILAIGTFTIHTTYYATHPSPLSLAVTIDITIGIPVLYYFIVSRKRRSLPIAPLLVFLICIGIASLVLPKEHQFYLDQVKHLLILTELIIVTYGFLQIRKIVRAYQASSLVRRDFVYNLTQSLAQIFGNSKAIPIIVGEISAIRYGLLFWIGKKEVMPGQNAYSMHKKSGYIALWTALCFIMYLETVGLHLLLWNWNQGVAIAATIFSLYTMLFLISDLAAIVKRPIVFYNDKLFFRIGLRWNAIIDLSKIQSVECIKGFHKEKGTLDCSLFGSPNMRIVLKEALTVKSFYGCQKKASTIVFNLDDTDGFIEELNY